MTKENMQTNDDILGRTLKSMINTHNAINKDLEILDKIKTDASFKALALDIIGLFSPLCYVNSTFLYSTFLDFLGRTAITPIVHGDVKICPQAMNKPKYFLQFFVLATIKGCTCVCNHTVQKHIHYAYTFVNCKL